MAETAPPHIRCTAVTLGYNISLGIVSGLSPLAATWLIERTGDELSPAFLIMEAAAISLLAVLRFAETYRIPITTGTVNADTGVSRRQILQPAE